MKNKILAALTIVSCVLLIGCGEAKPLFDGHDVRNSNWGEQVGFKSKRVLNASACWISSIETRK